MKLGSLTVLISASVVLLSPLSAVPISLVNPSFESETHGQYSGVVITGWEQADPGGTQFFGSISDVTAGYTSGLSGSNALWLTGTLTQLTSATFVTGVTYTLTFDVGNPSNVADYAGGGITVGFRTNANTGSGAFMAGGNGDELELCREGGAIGAAGEQRASLADFAGHQLVVEVEVADHEQPIVAGVVGGGFGTQGHGG